MFNFKIRLPDDNHIITSIVQVIQQVVHAMFLIYD